MCGYRTLTGARAPPTGPQAEGGLGPPHSQAKGREPPLSPFRLLGCWCGCPRAWVASLRVPIPLSVPLPGPVRQQARAAARKQARRAQPTFPPQPTRPAGHASQSSAGRSRRKKIQSYFPRACTGENIPLTPRVPASPARFGVHPPILGGASHQAGNLTPPYSAASNEAQTPLAPPKIQYAKWFRS